MRLIIIMLVHGRRRGCRWFCVCSCSGWVDGRSREIGPPLKFLVGVLTEYISIIK